MPASPLDYLNHILDEARYLADQVRGLSKEKFVRDETLKRAFARSIEIIGEAAKNVPPHVKQQCSQIDWRALAAMRDKVIHHYFGVDFDIVWDVAANKAPRLAQDIEKLLKDSSGS